MKIWSVQRGLLDVLHNHSFPRRKSTCCPTACLQESRWGPGVCAEKDSEAGCSCAPELSPASRRRATSTAVCLDVRGTTAQCVGLMERPTPTSVCSAFPTVKKTRMSKFTRVECADMADGNSSSK
eukprot:XP_015131931.1 serine protease inhibitor Kazal-type 2 isoform X1 [Gallus gallus]